MVRKVISLLILSSMILHCGARLGLLDYLYAKRSSIAFSLGLTAEKVISSCGLGHYQSESLAMANDTNHPGNPIANQAQEIQIFFQLISVELPFNFPTKSSHLFAMITEKLPLEEGSSLFHPPAKTA